MRESVIEQHLNQQVKAAGGETRKFASVVRPNNPDRIVIWPRVLLVTPAGKRMQADVHFVELKATGKKPRPGQEREMARLKKLGCTVFTLSSKDHVDVYVQLFGVKR